MKKFDDMESIGDSAWLARVPEELVLETMKLLNVRGEACRKEAVKTFLARFVGFALYQALMEKPDGPCGPKELHKFTKDNFNEAKLAVQDSISAAFTGAMKTFTGKRLEYYCQVKTVGEPINKKAC